MPSYINYKKIFIVVGFIVVTLVLLFLIVWMFFLPDKPELGDPEYIPPGAYLPETGEAGDLIQLIEGGDLPGTGTRPGVEEPEVAAPQPDVVARGGDTYALPMTDNRVLGVNLSTDGQGVVFYDQDDSRFYRISADGKSKNLMSDEKFHQVEDVVWAADSTKAIITYPDDIKVFYDFSTKKKVTLPKELTEPEFAQGTDKIAFKFSSYDTDSNFIGISNPDGTGAKYLEAVGDEGNKFDISISPDEEVIAFYGKPTSVGSSEVFLVGQQGENFQSLEIEGTHFRSIWSPQGTWLMYHVVMPEYGFRPVLWAVATNGSRFSSAKLNLGLRTWVEKCVFESESIIYCAVPRYLEEGAGLYEDEVDDFDDEIYKIDLVKNKKQRIASPITDTGIDEFRISNLQISDNGRFLFFWDANTQKVYNIQLR
jgi:hypothetical protein